MVITSGNAQASECGDGTPSADKIGDHLTRVSVREGGARVPNLSWLPWCIFLALVVAAEFVLAFWEAEVGMLLYCALLSAIVVYAGTGADSRRKASVALLFVPLIRIVGLALPLAGVPLISWYAFAGLPLVVAIAPAMRVAGISRRQLGLRRGNPLVQLGIASMGLPLGIISYDTLHPTALISVFSWRGVALPSLVLFAFTGLLEEIIFRGLLRVAMREVFGQWGILYGSAVFAALQIGNRSLMNVAFAFFVGVLFSWLVERSESIVGVSVAHGLVSVGAFLVFPFLPVPFT